MDTTGLGTTGARGSHYTSGTGIRDLVGGLDVGAYVDLDGDQLAPLTLLPAQVGRRWCDEDTEACQRLYLAVLELSLADAGVISRWARPGRVSAWNRKTARAWLTAPNLPMVLNLADCCAALGIDVSRVRRLALPVTQRRVLPDH